MINENIIFTHKLYSTVTVFYMIGQDYMNLSLRTIMQSAYQLITVAIILAIMRSNIEIDRYFKPKYYALFFFYYFSFHSGY